MFLKNVGSDACLVLTGTVELIDNKFVFTLDQTFDYADFKKATDTRVVIVKYFSVDDTSKSILGDINIGIVTAMQSVARFITMINHVPTKGKWLVYGLSPDANYKWSGYALNN